MKIALVTCSSLPAWEMDDRHLHDAFHGKGVELFHPAWDDPRFDWTICDAALIRATWDYPNRLDEFLAWARRIDSVIPLYNPPAVVVWNTNKTYLRDLASRGIPTIPTIWLAAGSQVDLKFVLAKQGWDRAFLKPAIGATARETLRFRVDVDGLSTAKRHLARLLPRESFLLQPYLERVEREGELSLIYIDGKFSHAVRKIPVPGDYRVQDDFGAGDEPADVAADVLDIGHRILQSVDHDLVYARVDLLRDDAGHLRLSELELTEPHLFFRHCPPAASRLVDALLTRVVAAGRGR